MPCSVSFKTTLAAKRHSCQYDAGRIFGVKVINYYCFNLSSFANVNVPTEMRLICHYSAL